MSVQNIQGYEVLDNGKPATIPNFSCWKNNFFTDFGAAKKYVEDWLGMYKAGLPENWQGEPWDYSGYGDKIEIRFLPGIEM